VLGATNSSPVEEPDVIVGPVGPGFGMFGDVPTAPVCGPPPVVVFTEEPEELELDAEPPSKTC